jgi:hypothetical protein
MFKLNHVLRDEEGGEPNPGGEILPEGESLPEGEFEESPPAGWLRDLTEDDAYERLQSVKQFPDHLRALESRLFGSMGPVNDKLGKLEKAVTSRVNFDAEKLQKAIEEYDPALAKTLGPALQEALNVTPIDADTISPFIEPVQKNMQSWVGEQVVLANYDPEDISAIIPDVQNGQWAPETQRHKDFIDWYSGQGYETQQSLLQFGAPYVRALRKFERWEKDRNKDREKTAGAKSSRLAGGQQPTSQGRRPRAAGPQTAEEAFLAGFKEVFE